MAGVGVGDGGGDGHDDGGGGAVSGDIGDEDAPLVVGEWVEVVVIAAGAGGGNGLVVGGDVDAGDGGEGGGGRDFWISPTALSSRSRERAGRRRRASGG